MSRFSIIYADPPWTYNDKAKAGQRGVEFKYSVMGLSEIKALPVLDLAADNCALFLWVTAPLLPDCISVIEAWGFVYKTIAFNWVKTYPQSGSYFMGMGNYTRANAELCLLGVRGRPIVRNHGVRSLIVSPVAEHSRKPDEVRERIVKLLGDLPRIELFARQRSPGWHAWGNQVDADLALVGNHFAAVDRPRED
jgi:N6-adenosine-specific RNA methylase IME4